MATYPTLFLSTWTSSQQLNAVKNTCASGNLQDYNGNNLRYANTKPYPVMDYPAIANAYKVAVRVQIANESATTRTDAR